MQRALFVNISNKTNRIRLKIENEKSKILKNDEDIKLPIRTFTLAPKQPQEFLPAREISVEKGRPVGKQHVRFKIDRSKTVKEESQQQSKQQQIRVKNMKQPKRKIINSFSTSKLIRLSKMDSQANESEEQNLPQNNTEYNQLIQIIELLKNRYLLFETGVMNYSIKKQDFLSLILFLVASQVFADNNKCKNYVKLKFGKFSVLQQRLSKLQKVVKEQMEQSLRVLALESNICDYSYNSDVYAMDQKVSSQKLTNMTEQLTKISRQLAVMREDKSQLSKLMKNMKSELSQNLKEKVDLETQVYQLKDLNRQLEMEISQKKKLVSSINQQAQSIFSYLNNDNCKIIERISVQYKEIEKEMHQYALYLQSNHMASEIGYEPRPFSEIEEVIVDEMKRINKTIIQDVEILPQLKQKLMRNFILRAMDKFKSKDLQMMKLNEFKTKCIRTYIQNIKKWLQNWTLKQEYLVNMRKQFIYDSQKLGEKVKKLKFIHSEGSILQISNLVEEVHDISEKIIENYKLGNSFY